MRRLRVFSETDSDLEMRAGLMDFMKKTSFSLFLAKLTIFCMFLPNSSTRLSMGRKSPLSPLARICARYLQSLDSKDSASLGESEKCLMMASRNNSSNDSASFTSFLGSISFRLISAA